MAITYNSPRLGSKKQAWSAEIIFTADGSGVFAAETLPDLGVNIFSGISVVFGATPPNALALTVDDADGIDLLSGAGASITSTKRITNSPPQIFSSGLTVTPTGNTTAGATITVKLYFI